MFSCEHYKIFKNTYFEEHLCTAASEVTLEGDCLGLSFWRNAFKSLTYKYYKNVGRFQTRALNTIGCICPF